MYANKTARLFDDQPGCRICHRENFDPGFDLFFPNIPSEPVGNLLGQEYGFSLSTAFRISDNGFTVLNVHGFEFQDLTNAHTASGHQLQHQPVPLVSSPEYDLVDHILFKDLELCGLASPAQFSERWIVTGILDFRIEGIFHEIEKGRQKGETESFGILLGAIRNRGHESKDVLGCDGS